MASIGFEWQFPGNEMHFVHSTDLEDWQSITLPSKSVVQAWPGAGVRIESDSGEVEFITSPVTTWAALLSQLVLIGEIQLALGMPAPEVSDLNGEALKAAILDARLGTGLGLGAAGAGGRPQRRAPAGHAAQRESLDYRNDHLRIVTGGDADQGPVFRNKVNSRWRLEFPVTANILGHPVVARGAEQPREVVVRSGTWLGLVGGTAKTYGGTPQATMERSLADMPNLLSTLARPAVQAAAGWIGAGASANLRGFAALLFYYRARFARRDVIGDKDGPKAGFPIFPRMNLRSVYRHVLDGTDRGIFDAKVAALSQEESAERMCPHRYKAGTDPIDNPLTWGEWLESMRSGDAGAAPATLDQDFAGEGPRGADYDRLSPPLGYPAHAFPGRASPWFTYAMGRENATGPDSPMVVEYREVTLLASPEPPMGYARFLEVALAAARSAGLDVPEG